MYFAFTFCMKQIFKFIWNLFYYSKMGKIFLFYYTYTPPCLTLIHVLVFLFSIISEKASFNKPHKSTIHLKENYKFKINFELLLRLVSCERKTFSPGNKSLISRNVSLFMKKNLKYRSNSFNVIFLTLKCPFHFLERKKENYKSIFLIPVDN